MVQSARSTAVAYSTPKRYRGKPMWWIIVTLVVFGIVLFWGSQSQVRPTIPTHLRGMVASNKVMLSSLISVAIELSFTAGERIKEVKNGTNMGVQVKGQTAEGVDEPYTIADQQSNWYFVNGFQSIFPEIDLLSEEITPDKATIYPQSLPNITLSRGDRLVDLRDIMISIDPLDATKEFTEDILSCVTTMVCIVEGSRPIAGIIYQPFDRHLVYGVTPPHSEEGGPDLVKGLDVRVASGTDADRIVVSRSHTGDAGDLIREKITEKDVWPQGGSGYKSLLVLSGYADAYVHTTAIKAWDICAGDALFHAAGGKLTDLHGNQLQYSKNQIQDESLAKFKDGLIGTTSPEKHQWYLNKLSR